MTGAVRTAWHTFKLAVRADARTTALTGFLVLAQSVAVAAVALGMRGTVDAVRGNSLAGVIAAAALGMMAFSVVSYVGRIQGNLRFDLSRRVEVALNQEIYATVAGIPTVDHLERQEYVDRLTMLRNGAGSLAAFCWSVIEALSALISLGLSSWLLYRVHPALVLLVLCAAPTVLLSQRADHLLDRVRQRAAADVRLEQDVHDLCLTYEPAKEIRIAGCGEDLDRRASSLWQEVSRAEAAARLRGVLWQTVGWACFVLGLFGSLVVVVRLLVAGRASLGDVVLVVALAEQMRFQVATAVSSAGQVGEAGRVTRHYRWLIEYAASTPNGTGRPPDRLTTGIALEAVTFCYPGREEPVLVDVNLRIPAGTTLGLVGVNGAGKTTLVKLLAGFYRPTIGVVAVDGRPLDSIDPALWATRCAGTLQDFAKFQFLVRETVGVGDLNRMQDSGAVLEAVDRGGATELVAGLPRRLETQLGTLFDGIELSHGQWQKLAIARGWMREAPLLLVLDEPTAALDPQVEHDLFENFTRQCREAAATTGAVTVLVSHRFSTVHMADQIVVLADGRIAEQGTHAELLSADGRYARLYRAQAHGYRSGA